MERSGGGEKIITFENKKVIMIQSRLLQHVSGLTHGFTQRSEGDMRQFALRNKIAANLTIPEQVHGNRIGTLDQVAGADGLVTDQIGSCVGVLVADCVPILLVDPKKRIVAAVHAGWRGTLGNIAANAVNIIGKDIFVSIGPHIGACCYTVSKERAQSFNSQCTYFDGTDWHLDLGIANRLQLMETGIPAEHIDAPPVCTSCQSDIFYSYRKDTKESFGEMLAFIGMNKKLETK